MRIGKFWVTQRGGRWLVQNCQGVVSAHGSKWAALKAAKLYSWRVHSQNETADPRRANQRAGGQY